MRLKINFTECNRVGLTQQLSQLCNLRKLIKPHGKLVLVSSGTMLTLVTFHLQPINVVVYDMPLGDCSRDILS